MKRFIIIALVLLTSQMAIHAIPAKPGKNTITQPDGTQLTLVLHGDEYCHFTTTDDGYTVVQGDDGFWYYAQKVATELVPTRIAAHDMPVRNVEENRFLSSAAKMIRPSDTPERIQFRMNAQSLWNENAMAGGPLRAPKKARYDYSKFRGLVILVEWSDRQFLRSDANDFYTKLFNTDNFTGFYTEGDNPTFVSCTGSVHDYYRDNSNGIFAPQLDVVGPINIGMKSTTSNGGNNMYTILNAAIRGAAGQVDYSDYDTNKDGYVDMVYFIFAGYGSHISGNNSSYVWPHASTLRYYTTLRLNGKRFDRYACSTEINDLESTGGTNLDGIGVVCHEFTHVLGLADHYDADYEESGGESVHPGSWDLMAGGGYLGNSFTPAGYNGYERYSLGFMDLETIDGEGFRKVLNPLNTSNHAYRMDTPQDKEYFIIENRQKTGWDAELPGHGMLVWRVDSTDATVWSSNTVNNNPEHNYFVLLRATPRGRSDSAGDPFPGSGMVTDLTNDSEPASLLSWAGLRSPYTFNNISENDGVITFNVGGPDENADIEDFEAMEIGGSTQAGVYCIWTLENAEVVATTGNYGFDNQVLALHRNAVVTSSALQQAVSKVSFNVWNASTSNIQIRFEVLQPGSTSWTALKENSQTSTSVTLKKNASQKLTYSINGAAGTQFRIKLLGTSASALGYVDNVKVSYPYEYEGATGIVDVQDVLPTSTATYNLSGQRISPDAKGLYIRNGKKYVK